MVKLATIAAVFASVFVVYAINQGELEPEKVKSHNKGTLFVEYYMPECTACENLESTWEKVAKEYNDVSFGKINCGKYVEHCKQHGIDKFPIIKAKINGNQWKEFTGDYDSLESVEQFVKNSQPFGFNFPKGESILLNTSEQLKHIIESKAPWFIKFYAPWCGHCKHLAPIWDKLAKKLEEKVRFGEINCEDQKELCSEYKIAGLPTLSYFVHGVNLKYAGSRAIDKLEKYATSMSGSPVHDIHDGDLEKALKDNDASFIYVYGKEGNELPLLEEIAPRFMDGLPFYKTNDHKTALRFNLADSELPVFVIAKDGDYIKYKGSLSDIESWVDKEKKPLVIKASSVNLDHIVRNHNDHRYAVLGISKLKDTEAVDRLREVAKRNEREGTLFAFMDGEVWGSYAARLYGLTSGFMPAAVIIDTKERVHYAKDASGRSLSLKDVDTVLDTLKNLDKLEGTPSVPSQKIGTIDKWVVFIGDHWILVSLGILVVFSGFFMLMTRNYPSPVKKVEEKKTKKAKKVD